MNLPNVFQAPIHKEFKNNEVVYQSNKDRTSTQETIDKKEIYKIFSSANHVYKTRLEITLPDKTILEDIVGIKDNKLLTIDNKMIDIEDIIDIKKV